MNNIQNNEIGHILCPYCKNDIVPSLKIIDFYITVFKTKKIPTIEIHRSFTLNETNKSFINEFCKNTLQKKPFISRIILTKPWYDARIQLVKLNLLDSEWVQ